MSGFKEVMKNGWHPEKSGTTIRGSVSSLVGRNKDSPSESSNHVARPLSDLKDPASFAPPPRRTGPGLAPAASPSVSVKRSVISSPSNYKISRVDRASHSTGPQEEEKLQRPSLPYRANSTGLSTQHLPKPPARRDGAGGTSFSSDSDIAGTNAASKTALAPPSLPPRLPPRRAPSSPGGEEKGQSLLNGASINRLGTAGVSVPALGIGGGGAAITGSQGPTPAPAVSGTGSGKWGSHVNNLQGRFAKMKSPSPATSAPEPPSQGTTWAQKQAALKTASNFHKDPSSVSFSDAKAAAATANNFRQRHGEQVASGVKTANNLNQKYGVMDKVSSAYAGTENPPPPQLEKASAALSGVAGKKKPPPPPPKKKPGLANPALAAHQEGPSPPPVPVSTRPAF
ncbi:hypothetical protein E4U42_002871 [Claviceps africana]|uniref:GMP synthase n=1 Tax=Claviceps africana TaxID=83212 RepID=A0A8K0NLP8_9HYPO|nr:hypothetical protein E4U42_002871 [Claviceps africana]